MRKYCDRCISWGDHSTHECIVLPKEFCCTGGTEYACGQCNPCQRRKAHPSYGLMFFPFVSVNNPSTEAPKPEGKHFDDGKSAVELLYTPALLGAGDVFRYGEKKYGRFNWTKGIHYTRVIASAIRHLLKWKMGEDKDPESGLCHLHHVIANVTMLCFYVDKRPELDDRWEK